MIHKTWMRGISPLDSPEICVALCCNFPRTISFPCWPPQPWRFGKRSWECTWLQKMMRCLMMMMMMMMTLGFPIWSLSSLGTVFEFDPFFFEDKTYGNRPPQIRRRSSRRHAPQWTGLGQRCSPRWALGSDLGMREIRKFCRIFHNHFWFQNPVGAITTKEVL